MASSSMTYPSTIEGGKLQHEWNHFKDCLASVGMLEKGMGNDCYTFHKILTTDIFARTYPNLLFLIRVKVVLWLQTAECERGFSLRTFIKTEQRVSMGNSLLDILMMISCNGPSIDDTSAVSVLMGATIQRSKQARHRFPCRSGAGVFRRKHKKTGTALGQR